MSQGTLGAHDMGRVTLSLAATIREAMERLETGGCGIALLVDAGQRLVGTITDGDLRRALLAGAPLESAVLPHGRRDFTSVDPAAGRAEVLDLMRARWLDQVPIVSTDGRLVGLHLLHGVIGTLRRGNWAVIMAGGRGERLRPITDSLPKPMICVAGRPILERLVLHLVSHGIHRIFLSVNYRADVIEQHFGDGARFGCQIEYLREEQPLGTGGALALLPQPPGDPVLLLNGDLITQFDVGEMVDFHARGGYFATLGIHPYFHPVPFGCVETSNDVVTRIEEKPLLCRQINAGIYVLSPAFVARVPAGRAVPITALFEEALQRSERVGAFAIDTDWLDVGQRDQLRQAREGSAR